MTRALKNADPKSGNRYDSPDRPIEYVRLLTHLNIAYGMAKRYGEPARSALRRAGKNMLAINSVKDWKVRALCHSIVTSNNPPPEELMDKLTEDFNRQAEKEGITYDGIGF